MATGREDSALFLNDGASRFRGVVDLTFLRKLIKPLTIFQTKLFLRLKFNQL